MIKFQFGKQKKSLKDIIASNAILHGTLDLIAKVTNQTKRDVFNSMDNQDLTEIISQDDELLSYRVEKEVDGALKDV